MSTIAKSPPIAARTTKFEVSSGGLFEQIKKSDGPVVLTRKGRARGIALDVKAFRQMEEQLRELEVFRGIRRGFEDIEQGRYLTLGEFRRHVERGVAVSGKDRGKRRR